MTSTTKKSAPTGPSSYKIETMRSADGALELRYSVFEPRGAAKQFVVFLNGRSEYVEKYAYVAEDLELPPNTGFLTMDHRGQGASGGARAFVDHYDSYASDAQTVIARVVGERPYVLMAHSMGALISLYGTLNGVLQPRALVLSSPLLGLPNKPLPRQVAKPLSRLLTVAGLGSLSTGAGGFEESTFASNVLTHDVERYKAIAASPYKLPGATLAWVTATFQAIEACFEPAALGRLTVPALVLSAAEESVVDPECARNWVQTAAKHSRSKVQLCTIPGARHELLSEIPAYYTEAVQAIKAWFKGHLDGWE